MPSPTLLLCLIGVIRHLSSFTLDNTTSSLMLSLQLIFFNPVNNHRFTSCNPLASSCNNVHVSHRLHSIQSAAPILYHSLVLLHTFVNTSFLLWNASFAIRNSNLYIA